ncbi:MAG: hypothetical protein ACMXYD_01745 [Candidatus Woesearchaeota archaeon]
MKKYTPLVIQAKQTALKDIKEEYQLNPLLDTNIQTYMSQFPTQPPKITWVGERPTGNTSTYHTRT